MNWEMIFSFLFSIFVLTGTGVVYAIFPTSSRIHPLLRKVAMGLIIAGIGVTLMGNSYLYSTGIFYDARSVIISISGMFLGWIPTLIGVLGMSITRLIFGGTGTVAGILSILTSASVGLLWRHYRLKTHTDEKWFTWWELYIVGLLTSIAVILSQLALPFEVFEDVLPEVILPLLVIYPIGQLLISYVMIIQRNQFFLRRKVEDSEEQYRRLFVESDIMQFIVNPESGAILDVTQKAIDTYGYSKQEFQHILVWELDLASKEVIQANFEIILQNKHMATTAKQRIKDGTIIDIDIYASPIRLGEDMLLLIVAIDKTEELKQKQLLQDIDDKFRTMLLSIGEGVIVVDETGHIALINQVAKRLSGNPKLVQGMPLNHVLRIYSKDHNKTIHDLLQHVLDTGETYRSDISYILMEEEEDKPTYIDFTIAPIFGHDDETTSGAVIVLRDITMEHRHHEEIRYISQHDHLTGLYNRYFFETELKRMDTKRQLPLSIIMADVNGLKLMNDAFSHLKGDEMLQKISSVLEMATRHEDIVCRWGGDEFAILLPQTTEEHANHIVQRIKEKISSTSFHVIQATLSLGLATKTEEAQPIYSIIKTAEERMYREKLQQGKSMRNSLLTTLEATLYEKSMETKEHADNMIDLAGKMGRKLHFNQDQLNTITLIARLHDIGKITISDRILKKQGSLTEEEWEHMRTHPETGSRIVKNIPELNHIAEGILCHHERFDGTGYPQGLKGTAIPLYSRIITIVDAYEVMSNGRSYQKAKTKTQAIEELKRCAGTQFDPELVEIFLTII